MKRLMTLLLLFAGVLISLILLLYFNQEKLIFFAERIPDDYQFKFQRKFEEGKVQLPSGPWVHYLHFPVEQAKGSILYFHGNAGSLLGWGSMAAEISERTGWTVLIADYPGFGKSSPDLPKNEKVLFEAAQLLLAKLKELQPQSSIVLWGRSVGSGVASSLAQDPSVAGMILETPYWSMARLGHEIYPILPESFSRFDLDNAQALKTRPDLAALILHGTQDEVIPQHHGRELSRIHDRTEFLSIEGGRHNDLPDFPEYWSAVSRFLAAVQQD